MTKRQYTREEIREYIEKCRRVEDSFSSTGMRDGKNYRAHCPFCVSSKTGQPDYSMDIEAGTGVFHCHRCNEGGKMKEAPDPSVQLAEIAPTVYELPSEMYEIGREPGLSTWLLDDARAYARKRYVSEVRARELGVGAVLGGWYGGRLIVPCSNEAGACAGFVARDWTGLASQPYMYPKRFNRTRFVFNVRALAVKTTAPLIVVEGVFDATPFWPHAVPTLGKPGEEHREQLMEVDRPIVLCPDGDAWREGRALALWLRYHGKTCGLIKLPPKGDPDEYVEDVWERAIECTSEDL